LRDSGYIYINTDDGWLDKNRTERDQQLHPSTQFTTKPDGIKALADGLHAKGFKFGIYLAAGESTCGNRAGSLYFEFSDAMQVEAFAAETSL
jgi:alpha-galactosidase